MIKLNNMDYLNKHSRIIGIFLSLLLTIIALYFLFSNVDKPKDRVVIKQKVEFFHSGIGGDEEELYRLDTFTFIDEKLVLSEGDIETFKIIDSLKCIRRNQAVVIANRLIYLKEQKKCN